MTTDITRSAVAAPARFITDFAKMLCADIDANQFADRLGTTINHPAFILGHVAYYAGVCVNLLGGDCDIEDAEAPLYEHGAECVDDATRYLHKDAAIAHFEYRMQMAATFVSECSPDVLSASSEGTPFAGRVDTLEEIAAFMLVGHPMFHLGQISAWRRVAGMPAAG